jgi:hypothetical protein
MFTIKDPNNIIAAFGLGLGAVFGMAGTFVVQPNLQALLWAIDGASLVMAAALLTLKYFRMGPDLVAGGFLVFAIAEAVLLSGTAAGPAAGCLRLPPVRRYGRSRFCSSASLSNSRYLFVYWGSQARSSLPSLPREFSGASNCCQPPRRCHFMPTPSLS